MDMSDDAASAGTTLGDGLVGTIAHVDPAAAQDLKQVIEPNAALVTQRDQAWELLSAAVQWAAKALEQVGVEGTDATPVRDSDSAFAHAQDLEQQSYELTQKAGFHDEVALLVDAVRRACYTGADLGPIPGGRIGSFARPGDAAAIVYEVEPSPVDLQQIGSSIGEALLRFQELGLGDAVAETTSRLAPANAPSAHAG